jgi:hypothetical protein
MRTTLETFGRVVEKTESYCEIFKTGTIFQYKFGNDPWSDPHIMLRPMERGSFQCMNLVDGGFRYLIDMTSSTIPLSDMQLRVVDDIQFVLKSVSRAYKVKNLTI